MTDHRLRRARAQGRDARLLQQLTGQRHANPHRRDSKSHLWWQWGHDRASRFLEESQ